MQKVKICPGLQEYQYHCPICGTLNLSFWHQGKIDANYRKCEHLIAAVDGRWFPDARDTDDIWKNLFLKFQESHPGKAEHEIFTDWMKGELGDEYVLFYYYQPTGLVSMSTIDGPLELIPHVYLLYKFPDQSRDL